MSNSAEAAQSATLQISFVVSRVRVYCNIIYALIMHDIKNRFFGSGLGQIMMILWPFVHLLVFIGVATFTKRPNPYGDSILQYASVSVFPFIIFNYVVRFIVFSATSNKNYLQYPIISPLDILVSRAILEIISTAVVAFLLILFLIAVGSNATPNDGLQAFCAIIATLLLAVGFAFLNASIAFIVPMWNLVVILIVILAYVASGVLFLPSTLPEQVRVPLSYNPLLNCIEWLRSSYYIDYASPVLDKVYVLAFGLTCLAAGLSLTRLLRRFY